MAESAIDRMGTAEPYGDAPAGVEEGESSIDLVALFQALRRGKRTIFRVTLGFFAFATVVAFLLPFQYTSAVSFIRPNLNNSSSMASALAGQLSALGAGDLVGGVKNPGDRSEERRVGKECR